MKNPIRKRWSSSVGLVAVACLIAAAQPAAAQLGARPAEQWIQMLDRPERIKGLNVDRVLELLRLKPGHVLADIGAGTGAFSLPLARSVVPGGKVYAVEVDQGLVDHITQRAETEGVENVEAVLGEFGDPALPAQDVDLAFFHDVLHHVEDRAGYLKNLARYIKPDGRIAVIERTDIHRGGRQRHMRMTKEQVTAWMKEAGFQPAEEYFTLGENKWFVVFSRP